MQDGINGMEWDGNRELLASCSKDRTVKIWTRHTKEPLQTYDGHKESVNIVQWSSTGPGTMNPNAKRMLASGSDDGTAIIWDVQYSKVVQVLSGKGSRAVTSVSFSPDGKCLATGNRDGYVQLWSSKVIFQLTIQCHEALINK